MRYDRVEISTLFRTLYSPDWCQCMNVLNLIALFSDKLQGSGTGTSTPTAQHSTPISGNRQKKKQKGGGQQQQQSAASLQVWPDSTFLRLLFVRNLCFAWMENQWISIGDALFNSFVYLPPLGLGTLKGSIWAHMTPFKGLQPRLIRCFWNNRSTRTPS